MVHKIITLYVQRIWQNLDEEETMAFTTIDNPELYFQTKLYSGSSSDVTVTFDGSEDMQPDLVWLKKRSSSGDPLIYDSVRGINMRLQTSGTDAEVDRSSNNDELKVFNTDGWTLGTFNSNVTGAGSTNVSWNWKESATAGFDIVSYAGNGAEGRNISHSLSAVPHLMIVKNRTNAIKWVVYHHENTSAPETDHLRLDTTAATSDDDSTWDDTAPTSSVFRVKSSTSTNGSSANYVAYLFSEKQGFSRFGSYLANNSTDGNFIYLGFRPAFFMVKAASGGSSSARNWRIYDNKRANTNGTSTIGIDEQLFPNADGAEAVNDNELDFLSNGIKLRANDGGINTSGETYVFVAFAEAPFVNSNKIPCNGNGAE